MGVKAGRVCYVVYLKSPKVDMGLFMGDIARGENE